MSSTRAQAVTPPARPSLSFHPCPLSFDNWKLVFLEQRCQGTLRVWAEPYTQLRVPKASGWGLRAGRQADEGPRPPHD